MAEKMIEMWNSQRVEWHIERGLKLQADGSALTGHGRAVTLQQLAQLNPTQRKAFHKEAKQAVFCISSKNHGMLTAHQASSGMQPNDKVYA
jgi:hypothetical protein